MPEAWKDRRAAGRDLRKVVPRSAHAEWAPPADRPDPVVGAGRRRTARGFPSSCRSATGGWRRRRSRSSAARAAIMAMRSRRRAGDRPPGRKRAATRTSATSASSPRRTQPGLRHQRLRRDAARAVGVGRQAARRRACTSSRANGASGRRRATRSSTAAVRAYREHMAEAAELRTLDLWYDADAHPATSSHTSPRSTGRVSSATSPKARRKDQRRAVAKLTHAVGDDIRFVEDPPLIVHLDNTDHELDDDRSDDRAATAAR